MKDSQPTPNLEAIPMGGWLFCYLERKLWEGEIPCKHLLGNASISCSIDRSFFDGD